MGTNFGAMSHEQIYHAVKSGSPTTVSGAASDLTALNHTISGHLDTLDKLSTSMADAWPDENGQNFRSTLSDTISYLRELQATHVVSASSSVTQVMSASHEKLSHTQSTIPPPPAVPVADQEKTLSQQQTQHDGALTAGMAAEGQHIAAAKADDAKAVALAKSLANTYLAEKAKLTAPPAAPKGPSHSGSGTSTTPGGSNSTSSNHAMAGYNATTGSGNSASDFAGSGNSSSASFGNSAGHPSTFSPAHNGNTGGLDTGSSTGSDGGSGLGGTGSAGGQFPGGQGAGGQGGSHHGNLLDPNANSALYDANGNLIGTGSDPSSNGFAGGAPVNGVLGGAGSDGGGLAGGGSGFGAGALGAGLVGAGLIAARKEAARRASQQAALLKQELSEEEAGAGGAGRLSASQLAAINAQRNGILSAGEQAGLMNGERTMLAAQQRGLVGANAAMTAQEEAQLAAGQRMVPGQLGATAGPAAAAGARTGMPFAGGGVVGGAERVTWLVEDRDLFSADPGVRAIIEE